ncbi:MAG: BlaI/MecI/CopY family transcriptional regulator [Planctomycetota bacterium]|nr:MAG: BlaI/MecI/CopY family transcriptional regulator [Planctomycetota bacterium]REJ90911.1 MAG: BlaI/MecI/CopY family transcriptional regulator [Planctomycetota bacterium]REK17688.1 MAG: BlaI/MecI/CopY family transcriptional regulator [Planctomycetota bacterium]REK46741.1 MAG: BlaI/MecI/CopY family transcriptional regulator [Planctomycetota bacterium]
MSTESSLSRRERQIMDIVYRLGEATVSDVLTDMKDSPTRTSVRTMMRILEEKGQLKHRVENRAFVYRPTASRKQAGRSALRRVLSTFFEGSIEHAVAAYISDPRARLTAEQKKQLAKLIQQARDEKE